MKAKRKPKKVRKQSSLVTVLVAGSVVLTCFSLTIALRPTPSQSAPVPLPVTVAPEDDMVLIPAPTRSIALGEKLSNVAFVNLKWPKSRMVGVYVTDIASYKDAIATAPLPQYLPVPISSLSTTGFTANAVVERIPEGMRAITVTVDAEAAVEGWARSNNYVDVIVIRNSRDTDTGLETKVIAENVRILSADRSANPVEASGMAPKAPTTVTLLTSQDDALRIKTASSIGKLAFALRGKGDESPATVVAMNQKEVLGSGKSITPTEEYQGYARDATGRLYVLGGDTSRWIRSATVPKGISSAMLAREVKQDETSPAPPGIEAQSTAND